LQPYNSTRGSKCSWRFKQC